MSLYDKAWDLREKLCRMSGKGFIGKIQLKIARRAYTRMQEQLGFSIPANIPFGTKPYFPHGLQGIFISRRATIGKNCVIFHQVTIGVNTMVDSRGVGAPVIGDRVFIGVGAKIIGGIRIGNDVRIGANAVVTRDVPHNATVIGLNDIRPGVPGRDNRYISRGPNGWLANDGVTSVPVAQEHADLLERAIGSA